MLSLLSVTGAWAQTVCDDALRQAQKSYDLGLFEDVPGLLAPCLAARPSRATAVQVHSLLARAYLAADDPKKARQEVSAILRLDSSFEPGSTPLFAELVAQVRREEQTVQVASVSKSKESLREAPATVALLTAEEIERRGYNDLEEMLHDLPGFDISRSRGRTYSNIYQRGFRSNTTDRTLFLVDGVEQNDLWSNIAYISRQYPVSDIERVEVVYGPASTMYGANAFAGVINVITKESSKFYGKDKKLGAEAHVTSGSWNTRTAELSLGGRNASESIRWSMTGRTFTSDEPPISQFADWNFNPDDVENVDYRSTLELSGKNAQGQYIAQLALADLEIDPYGENPLYVIHLDESGTPIAVTPTEAGIEEARRLDRIGLATAIDGRPAGPLRSTEDWFLSGKLELPNFVAGVQLSHVEEGDIGSSTDLAQAGNKSVAAPRSLSLYAKYFRELGASTSLTLFSRYRKHDFSGNNAITSFRGFVNRTFNVLHLEDRTPEWSTIYSYQASTQLQTELTVLYEPSPALSLISGLEIRDSSLQIALSTSFEPDAGETGSPGGSSIGGSNQLDQLDAGAFTQVSYRPRENVKIVAGGRLDYDRVRTTLGYGTVFNPRLAVIYTPRAFVFKAVYAEGFKTPSNSEKYGTVPLVNEVENPDLDNEKVKNLEISAGWEGRGGLAVDLSAYQSTYSNIVALREVQNPNCLSCGFTGQFQNIGKLRVRGVQAQARYRHESLDAYLSYTFTQPFNTDPLAGGLEGASQLRVADIASHRLNGGLHVELRRSLGFDLRANFVGPRKTGVGTTVPTNPFGTIASYTTTNAAFTFEGLLAFLKPLRTSRLLLGIDNLFDKTYYDPGVAEARNVFAARLPQAGRSVFLRLSTSY
ncbi:MAG: TonB-dependent receptor [Thermoanaerobaculia bacterium]